MVAGCSAPTMLGKGSRVCSHLPQDTRCHLLRQLATKSRGRGTPDFLVSVALTERGLAWVLGELTAVSPLAIFLSVYPFLVSLFCGSSSHVQYNKNATCRMPLLSKLPETCQKTYGFFFPLVTMDHLSEDLNFRCNIKIFYRVLKSWLIVF